MQKKSTERVKLGPAITPQCKDLIDSMWDRPNTGATFFLDAMPGLYSQTLKEIAGIFEAKELYLMIDVMNGTMLTAGIAGQHIIMNVLDGIHYESLDTKWEISREEIAEKLQALSLFQRACLELWVQAFWQQHEEIPLKDYVKIIAA